VRIWLKHETPYWVQYPEFFITISTRPKHLNQLCLPERSDFILRSAEEYHRLHRWHCSLMVLMPDHLHALIQVPERLKLYRIISSWKSYLTKNLGIRWHRGFFDHRIRRSESLNEKWNYIVMNPVRAGFVTQPKDWPHRWSPEGRDDLGRAGGSSVPSLNHSPLHLPAAIGGAIPTSALARSCSITLFASRFNACDVASVILPP